MFQAGLRTIGTPLGYGCRVFAKLLSKPLVGPFLLGQHYFQTVQVFVFHVIRFGLSVIDGKDNKFLTNLTIIERKQLEKWK
jgi:hypothetical protein